MSESPEHNGHNEERQIPAIGVGWDVESQTVALRFDPHQFKTWDMVIMVLTAALKQAEWNQRAAQAKNLQQAEEEAKRNEQLRRQLMSR